MQNAVSTLWDWLAVTDQPAEVDIIFLFGSSSLSVADKGAELYALNLSPIVVATGAHGTFSNPEWSRPAAEVYASHLRSLGVPQDAILIQNTSTNTIEDVTHTTSLLGASRIAHASAIIISRPVHQRRAWATYTAVSPATRLINVPSDEPHPSTMSQQQVTAAAVRCLQEYERLQRYASQGDLIPQPVPADVKRDYAKLKNMLL